MLVALTGLLLAPLLASCTEEDEPEAAPTPEPTVRTSESGAPRLVVDEGPMQARVVRVGGNLTDRERSQVRDNIARVVGRWLDAAYLGGPAGTGRRGTAFELFTPSAARQAARRADVTTNRVLGPELVQVVPTVRRVEAAVFAPDRGPAGATAQLTLVFVGAREDGSQVEQVVRGQLFLTATPSGWRAFGFDLRRSEGAVGSFSRAQERPEGRP